MVIIFTVLGISGLILSVLTTVVNPDNCLHLLNYVVFVHRYVPGVLAAKCYTNYECSDEFWRQFAQLPCKPHC